MSQHITRHATPEETEQLSQAERLQRAAETLRSVRAPRERREPPEDNDKRLGTLRRADDEEVRITWAEYNERNFLSVRLWKRGSDGSWWPDRSKGFTIRVRELPAFADAVMGALQEAATSASDPR